MKVKELKEGLLDNIMSGIQSMAGGDGITGFFRGLAGGGARLERAIDLISGEAERMLVSGQTNIRQPGIELPMDKIIDAVFVNASRLSQGGEQVEAITKDGLFKHLKEHKADILKGINAQSSEAGLAPKVVDMIEQHVAGQPVKAIDNLDFKRTVRAVSLVSAVTLLDYEFRSLAQTGSSPKAEVQFDPAAVKEIQDLGDQINDSMFTPGGQLQRLIPADENFKTNLEWFVTQIILEEFERKYLGTAPDQLRTMLEQPLIKENQIRSAIMGHQPNLSPEAMTAVGETVTKNLQILNSFLSKLLALLIQEKESGGDRAVKQTYGLLTDWARSALKLIDTIKVSAAGKKKTKGGGEEVSAKDLKVSISGQEIKTSDPLYNRILDLVKSEKSQ